MKQVLFSLVNSDSFLHPLSVLPNPNNKQMLTQASSQYAASDSDSVSSSIAGTSGGVGMRRQSTAATSTKQRQHSRKTTVLSLFQFGSTLSDKADEDSNSETNHCQTERGATPVPASRAQSFVSGFDALNPHPCHCSSSLSQARAQVWNLSFEQGLFSDIELCVCNRVFKLHRVVLMQSRLFANLFTGGNPNGNLHPGISYTLDIAGAFMSIDASMVDDICAPGVHGDSIEVALRDLYTSSHRAEQITAKNAFQVLTAACFLQIEELIQYCIRFIVSSVSKSNIAFFASEADTILTPSSSHAPFTSMTRSSPSLSGANGQASRHLPQPHSEFLRLRNLAKEAILPHLESFLCHAANEGVVSLNGNSALIDTLSQNIADWNHQSVYNLLAECPISWFKLVVENNALCLPDEFTRYQFLKGASVARWKHTQQISDEASSTIKRSTATKRASGFFGSLFNQNLQNGSPSDVKNGIKVQLVGRKEVDRLGSFNASGTASPQTANSFRGSIASFQSSIFSGTTSLSNMQSHHQNQLGQSPTHPGGTTTLTRLVNLYGQDYLKSDMAASKETDAAILHMFETSIIYTYMTFAQLERVKADRIVSDTAVLNSFWMQAELINRFTTPTFPGSTSTSGAALPSALGPFRFSAKFSGLQAFVIERADAIERGEKVVVASEPIKCAGIDFRLLLSVEVGEKFRETSVATGEKRVSLATGTRHLQTPLLLNMNRSRSIDDLNPRANHLEMGILGQYFEDSTRPRRFVLKASLQRSRMHSGGVTAATTPRGHQGASQGQGQQQPIAFSIFAFNAAAFRRGVTLSQRPVTMCDFEGSGYAHEFGVPFAHNFLDLGGGGEDESVGGGTEKRIGKQKSMYSKMKVLGESLKMKVGGGNANAGGMVGVVSGVAGMGALRKRVAMVNDEGKDIWLAASICLFPSES
ncbi:hypothetical protein BC830DRAFT_1138640 [Chytriomyces sp. MP71]|nr:hypothetical protein BC830DRAFT_1138640 [Chytriomyces sp. MP71]